MIGQLTWILDAQASIFAGQEWLIVLLVILLLFGGAKIPQLARGVGRSVSEFQEGIKEGKDKMRQSLNDDEPARRDESRRDEPRSEGA
ncbi:MAG: twin-arginine translocase TatA/TatE family subunit [Armatimonadetes bacterium]|nr:twin-arginine translocase TatA/TatE family subunit [Armatimonadota bacterium]